MEKRSQLLVLLYHCLSPLINAHAYALEVVPAHLASEEMLAQYTAKQYALLDAQTDSTSNTSSATRGRGGRGGRGAGRGHGTGRGRGAGASTAAGSSPKGAVQSRDVVKLWRGSLMPPG